MIHGSPTSLPRYAPHREAGSPARAAVAQTAVVSAPAKQDALPVMRLLIAVAMIFAFGVLAPMISAAVR
jgi:hypothetical protein